jgi:acyl carrier protein
MIEQKIKQIIAENVGLKQPLEEMGLDLELIELGVNSTKFIKIVVAIEVEFDIEFCDEDLNYGKFPNLESLVVYVQGKVN